VRLQGKALRSASPRSTLGHWAPSPQRPEPLAMLAESNAGRVPDLIPVRYGRMRRSPFAFLRGSANIMAYDLGTAGHTTGIAVQACGDCHIANFGIFATPERNIVFDINDFDETLSAPWEWDVKRLAASIHLAARAGKSSEPAARDCVRAAARAYRDGMARCAAMTKLEVWYARIDATEVYKISNAAKAQSADPHASTAGDDTHELIAEQYTQGEGLNRRFADKPPKLFHPLPGAETTIDAAKVLEGYRLSLRSDIAVLMSAYELVDVAVKVVGIGSVGTRCDVALMMAHENDGLILQIKEARKSVLEPYAQPSPFDNQGQRVVAGQRLMQTASDACLGWSSGDGHDYYVRQLSDAKGSVDSVSLTSAQLHDYAALCGRTLALAHARSGPCGTIAGYLGNSDAFERAMAAFGRRYADQVEKDYDAFLAAIARGDIDTQSG